MDPFLSDYFSALGSVGGSRAAFVLDSAKIQKGNMDMVSEKVSSSKLFNPVKLQLTQFGDYIKSVPVHQALFTAMRELQSMYDLSNDISVLMESNAEVLSSELGQLNEEISALEKAVDNYAFMLSDGGSYDVSYMEKFSDELGRAHPPFRVTDRGDSDFFAQEAVDVDQEEGVIRISANLRTPSSINPVVLANNCSQYESSSNDIRESITDSSTTGWQVTVSTPTRVSSSLQYPGLGRDLPSGGIQYLIEYAFDKPSAVDTISISPLSRVAVEVLDIFIFESLEHSFGKSVISEPFAFGSKKTISFPLQTVAKTWVVLRGLEYERPMMSESSREILHKLYSRPLEVGMGEDMVTNLPIREIARNTFKGAFGGHERRSMFNPKAPVTSRNDRGPLMGVGVLNNINFTSDSIWFSNSNIRDIMAHGLEAIFAGTQLESLLVQLSNRERNNLIDFRSGPNRNVGSRHSNTASMTQDNEADIVPSNYKYHVGIRNFSIGASVSAFRGYFMSLPVPATGDINEVRLKANDQDYEITDTNRDSTRVTSIEYSVTNQSRPDKEDLWIPILPVNTNQILGERFFPDALGKGYLRFPASIDGDIALFRNGYLYTDIPITDMIMVKNQAVIGLRIPLQSISVGDIFTCNYKPSGDRTVVSFANENLPSTPLVSSFDKNGAGEGFNMVGGGDQLTVNLSNHPYVDYSRVSGATYNSSYGLGPYNPVIVKLESGSLVYNLTNYKGGTQSILSAGSDNYQFIHSGNTLIFNKAISENFRVYYQYLPSNVQFRVILRSNDTSFISPKVDSIQIKGKSRKPDAKRGF
jgi:hypothetical protein